MCFLWMFHSQWGKDDQTFKNQMIICHTTTFIEMYQYFSQKITQLCNPTKSSKFLDVL